MIAPKPNDDTGHCARSPTMNQDPASPPTAARASVPLHRRLRWAAWIILFVGLVAAGLVYITAPDADADSEAAAGTGYDFAVERIGGQAAVRSAHFNHWLASLTQGRPLAITLAVGALVIALACFWLASFVDESRDVPEPD
jgi:hypothetical protein